MGFILKIYHSFQSYQNMLITLGFCSLYHKLQLCLYSMHITPHLHVIKDFWNLMFFKNPLNFKEFQIPSLLDFEFFSNAINRLISYKFSYHQFFYIKRVLYLILCRINHIWCNYLQSSNVFLLKPKFEI